MRGFLYFFLLNKIVKILISTYSISHVVFQIALYVGFRTCLKSMYTSEYNGKGNIEVYTSTRVRKLQPYYDYINTGKFNRISHNHSNQFLLLNYL